MSASDIADPAKLKAGMNGTGPYKFVSYQNDSVSLVANENYWDKVPQIKNITYSYVADAATRLAALQSGQADLIERDPDQIPTIKADPNLDLITVNSIEQRILLFSGK